MEAEIKQFMKENNYSFNEDWLKKSLDEYLKRKNNSSNSKGCHLAKDYILEKWKETNLRNFNFPKKSLNFTRKSKNIEQLTGIHCVQIESAINIKVSFYNQYKDPKYEESTLKGDRQYLFKITDGVNELLAVEDESLDYFNKNHFIPGLKAMLIGPITYVNKRLFLRPKNIEILGGLIDEYLEQNDSFNIIKQNLNIKDDKRPPKRNQEINQSIENKNKSKSNSQNLLKDEPFGSDEFENLDELLGALETDISLADDIIKKSPENKIKQVQEVFDIDDDLSAYIEQIVDNELDSAIDNSNQNVINSNLNQAIPKRDDSNYSNNSKNTKLDSKSNSSKNTLEKNDKKRSPTEDLNRKTKMHKPDEKNYSPSKNKNSTTRKEEKMSKSEAETITSEISQKMHISDLETLTNTQSNSSQSQPLNKSQIEEEIGVTSLSEIIRAHQEEDEEDIFVTRVKSKKCMKKLSSLNNRWSMTILITDGTDQLPFVFTNNVLKKIISMSAQEYNNIRASGDKVKYEQLLKQVGDKIKDRLKNLDAIMTIEYKSENEYPNVLNIIKYFN